MRGCCACAARALPPPPHLRQSRETPAMRPITRSGQQPPACSQRHNRTVSTRATSQPEPPPSVSPFRRHRRQHHGDTLAGYLSTPGLPHQRHDVTPSATPPPASPPQYRHHQRHMLPSAIAPAHLSETSPGMTERTGRSSRPRAAAIAAPPERLPAACRLSSRHHEVARRAAISSPPSAFSFACQRQPLPTLRLPPPPLRHVLVSPDASRQPPARRQRRFSAIPRRLSVVNTSFRRAFIAAPVATAHISLPSVIPRFPMK